MLIKVFTNIQSLWDSGNNSCYSLSWYTPIDYFFQQWKSLQFVVSVEEHQQIVLRKKSIIQCYSHCCSFSGNEESQQGGGIAAAMQKLGLNQGMLAGIAASIFSAFMR